MSQKNKDIFNQPVETETINGVKVSKSMPEEEKEKLRKCDAEELETITEEDLKLKNRKVKISMWMDGDLLQAIKIAAKDEGENKYTTFLNKYLRKLFVEEEMPEFLDKAFSKLLDKKLEKKFEEFEKAQNTRSYGVPVPLTTFQNFSPDSSRRAKQSRRAKRKRDDQGLKERKVPDR